MTRIRMLSYSLECVFSSFVLACLLPGLTMAAEHSPTSLSDDSIRPLGSDVVSLTIKGNPGNNGTPVPGYGIQTRILHSSYDCSFSPPLIATNEAGDIWYELTGWKLYDISGTEPSLLANGTGSKMSYQQQVSQELLEWEFKQKVMVTFNVVGEGTVSEETGWRDHGKSMTITATPSSGKSFSHWEGDIGENDKFSSTITVVADQPRVITARFLRVIHVSKTGDDTADGLTWETAVNSIAKAMELALPGDTVLLGDGVFDVASEISLTNKWITLTSVHGRDKTIINGNHACRLLYLNHPEAIVDGITLKDGNSPPDSHIMGGGFAIGPNGGTVRNCRVTGTTSKWQDEGGDHLTGISVKQEGGLVSSCVIDHNGHQFSQSGTVLIAGGVFENCLVHDNAMHHSGAGLYITGGVARNCTITRNKSSQDGCGVFFPENSSGLLENCIVWGNINSKTPYSLARDIAGGKDRTVINCCHSGSSGTATVRNDPRFFDPVNGDFRIPAGSHCVNAGNNSDELSETDFAGNPRKSGTRVDIGAYEVNLDGFSCGFRASTYHGAAPLVLDLQPLVFSSPCAEKDLELEWTLDSGHGDPVVLQSKGLVFQRDVSLDAGLYTVTLKATDPTSHRTASETVPNCIISCPPVVHVVKDNPHPVPPYSSWEDAAPDLESAFRMAADGSTVLVSNGVYVIQNQLVFNHGITLQGLNGYENTVVTVPQQVWQWDGVGPERTNGVPGTQICVLDHPDACVRGMTFEGAYTDTGLHGAVQITGNGGTLDHCRITRNFSKSYDSDGAGIRMSGGLVTGCLIDNNEISLDGMRGGGVYMEGGILENSLIVGNRTYTLDQCSGGGVYLKNGTVRNCTIMKNSANQGGGIYLASSDADVLNCIIRDNISKVGNPDCYSLRSEYIPSVFNNNCIPQEFGAFCMTDDPAFVNPEAGDYSLTTGSPCIDKGSSISSIAETDFLGNPRRSGVQLDLGACEYDQSAPSCGIVPSPGNARAPVAVSFKANTLAFDKDPESLDYVWTFDDGAENPPTLTGKGLTTVRHDYDKPGRYNVRLEVSDPNGGQSACTVLTDAVQVAPDEVFVVAENANSAPPYDTWETACTDVLEALSWTADGSIVTVGDGVYDVDREIFLDYPVVLRSRNGYKTTTLKGRKVQGVRVVQLAHDDAVVDGFTIRGGCSAWIGFGGGVHVEKGTLKRCLVTDNNVGDWTTGAGVSMIGGLVSGCIISNNASDYQEQGFNLACGGLSISGGIFENSIITDSSAGNVGGVRVDGGILRNCTIVGNRENNSDGVGAGGVLQNKGVVENCIVWGNRAASGSVLPGVPDFVKKGGVASNNCSSASFGTNSVVANPRFRDLAAGDFRIGRDSPCHDAGLYEDWMDNSLDCWGNPRHDTKNRVDIGAYEDHSSMTMILMLR